MPVLSMNAAAACSLPPIVCHYPVTGFFEMRADRLSRPLSRFGAHLLELPSVLLLVMSRHAPITSVVSTWLSRSSGSSPSIQSVQPSRPGER